MNVLAFFQLAIGLGIFLERLLEGNQPLAISLAALLLHAILVTLGALDLRRLSRALVLGLKMAVLIVLMPYSPFLPLLFPAMICEAWLFLPKTQDSLGRVRLFFFCLALLSGLPLLFIARQVISLYVGICLVSLFSSSSEFAHAQRAVHARTRLEGLEAELGDRERELAAALKAGADRELMAALKERDSLSQRLHDELGHSVTGALMQLEAAGLILKEEPEKAISMMERARGVLREGLDSIRSALRALKPECALMGRQALRVLLEGFAQDHGWTAELDCGGDLNAISSSLWEVILENAREALTNALKHGKGKRFLCLIQVLNGMIKVEYRSQAAGGPTPRYGMGLSGMEERCARSGGTLLVDTLGDFSIIMLFKRGEA